MNDAFQWLCEINKASAVMTVERGIAFRRQASRTTDPDIRRFVTRFLEVEEKHDAIARRLAERAVASRSPVIQPPRTGDTMPVISPPTASKMPVISPSEPARK